MITYIVNISTLTRRDDAYKEVVTNLYPIIIRTYDIDHLKDILVRYKDEIKKTLKNKYLYDHAKFYIRTLNDEEFTIPIKDVVKLEYC